MGKQLPRKLEVPQLLIRSACAGLDDTLSSLATDVLKFALPDGSVVFDLPIKLYRYSGMTTPATPRVLEVSLRDMLALARLESDSPARAPIRDTPPRLTAPPPAEGRRLVGMLAAVVDLMKDGQWWTLAQLQTALRIRGRFHELPAISARIRDMRKPEFGARHVEREKDPKVTGLFRYRLMPRQ